MSYIEESLLGTHAKIFNGKTPSKSEQREVGFPVLKIRDIDETGDFRGQFNSFVEASLAEKFAEKKVAAGDTLILNAAHNADYVGSKSFYAKAGEIGSLATGEWLIVRPNATVLNPLYLHYWLTSDVVKKALRELVKGIHLYPKDVARLKLKLPPLEEQKRIAAILDQADSLRRLRQRSLDRLNTLSQAIFYEMFGDPVVNPKGLKSVPLAEVASFTSGATPSKAVSGYWGGSIPWVSPKDMKSIEINDSIDHVSDKAISETNIKLIPDKTPLIVVRGMILAHTVPLAITGRNVTINQDIKAIRFAKSVLPLFGLWCLKAQHTSILNMVDTAAHGTKRLDTEVLGQIPVLVPDLNLQIKFTDRVLTGSDLIAKEEIAVTQMENLFASLQHRAFRGEL